MLFELKQIIQKVIELQLKGEKSVLATVVDLDGSSYRKPGVRMLISESGEAVGAVSGGCVEKEIIRQSQRVFEGNTPIVLTYDGRYRLGCEGVIHILIEPIELSSNFITEWSNYLESRNSLHIRSNYLKGDHQSNSFGSCFFFRDQPYAIRGDFQITSTSLIFEERLNPTQRLIIIGAEHDAVQMCLLASNMGMEVILVTSIKDPRQNADFPGVSKLVALEPDQISEIGLDDLTAVILMTHSYSRDFQYAISILNETYAYFGVIGSTKRRSMLMDELLQFKSDIDLDRLDQIYSPAGLDIGSITPQEIAISVLAEILAVMRKKELPLLKEEIRGIRNK